MNNSEFQWLTLKIDETAAKKWSACLLCWFSTKGKTGRRITLHGSICHSRYFTVLLSYVRICWISSFSGWYWKLTKRRQKNRWHAFAVDSPPKVRLEDGSLFMDPSATHDTLQFYCTMLGYAESRVSVADIENWRNGGKKTVGMSSLLILHQR